MVAESLREPKNDRRILFVDTAERFMFIYRCTTDSPARLAASRVTVARKGNMYNSPNVTPAVKARIGIERKIVKLTVKTLLESGFELAVHDGEEWHNRTTDAKKLHDALMETDEDRLFVYRPDGPKGSRDWFGWVFFVYGNDGPDVINDYTVNLEDVLAPVNKYAERFE